MEEVICSKTAFHGTGGTNFFGQVSGGGGLSYIAGLMIRSCQEGREISQIYLT